MLNVVLSTCAWIFFGLVSGKNLTIMPSTQPTRSVDNMKLARHPQNSWTYPPKTGAIQSVMTSDVVVYDHTFENSAPLKQSLAIARFKTPQDPAPIPATKRAINNRSGEVARAHAKLPTKKILSPIRIMTFLP